VERKWEEYDLGPSDARSRMHVTLSNRGEILVGAKTFDRMGRPDAAVLLFDRENRMIGLRPTHPRVANAYLFGPKKNGRHSVIRASSFCRDHGIKVDRTTIFKRPVIEKGILILDLNETCVVSRRDPTNPFGKAKLSQYFVPYP
jgi:hypothetical protein